MVKKLFSEPASIEETPPSIETITLAFKASLEAAKALADTEDSGTCNFDCAVVRPGRYSRRFQVAAKAAGVRLLSFTWFGRTAYGVQPPFYQGDANRRCRIAKAMTAAIRANGVHASTYQKVD
jgi:hypothetical protein